MPSQKNLDGDPRIARALDTLRIRYELDRQGDFKLSFDLGDNRSQVGFVRSTTYEFAGIELREITSIAFHSPEPLDTRTCHLLLDENESVKIGAWGTITNDDDSCFVAFTVKVAADLDPETLLKVISAVFFAADDLEKRLTGRDRY